MNTSKNSITVDGRTKKIFVTNTFYKKASVYGSDAYYQLLKATTELPNYEIAFKSSQKRTYKNLSIACMEEYIKTQPESEKQLTTFYAVQKVAQTKGAKYPLTKQWFLSTYPDYKKRTVTETEYAALSSLDDDPGKVVALDRVVNE